MNITKLLIVGLISSVTTLATLATSGVFLSSGWILPLVLAVATAVSHFCGGGRLELE